MRRASAIRKGGAIGPSSVRAALVVSADPAVRADWARYFEALGLRTIRCVGPQAPCPLLDGGRCRLHEDADLAVYDRSTVTPELALRLIRSSRSLPVAFAADRLDAQGQHEPLVTAVASEGRSTACVGTDALTLGR
ncbi:MAG TPA: hypothetical protein VIN69_06315 [Candidatus Limnocylindria bacterium]|jgi:hypothetical protein